MYGGEAVVVWYYSQDHFLLVESAASDAVESADGRLVSMVGYVANIIIVLHRTLSILTV